MSQRSSLSPGSTGIKTIAVCAAQVPFFSGGAEAHVGGLVEQLRARGFEVDLINVPYKWYPREQLLKSIRLWESIDLTESNGKKIDLVIATKFPSYFVNHPRKVLWLIHQYRQMYDLMNTEFAAFDMTRWSDRNFRRRLVNMDTKALSTFERRFTNAKNTAHRLHKYNNLQAEELYHPPPLSGRYHNIGYGDYILSVGRLDRLKRVDTLIRALPYAGDSVLCKIAGTGPARDDLESLAKDLGVDARVEFLGHVTDEYLLDLYAKCAAVFFSPIDEDYGYVTLEAFLSGKPVITAPDSGGPLEFVQHGENGLVLDCANEVETGLHLKSLLEDKSRCERMGKVGFAKASSIGWDNVIRKLVYGD